ncbi:MAG: PHP domain-containing protein [Clostridia bacterium]|nr:PHP domain-containing protein [Clostridia bacterium]
MLIDMHTHSSGISGCCQLNAFEIVEAAKEAGLDGIILTNHYDSEGHQDYGSKADYVENYIKEYYEAKACGERVGLKVFFGIEVTAEFMERIHLLVYGVAEDFLRNNPELYNLSLKELYELVHKNGGVLVQAHPFRHNCPVLDTDYLDALEINCHPLYKTTHYEDVKAGALKGGVMLTCGSDYHGDTYRAFCGVCFPEDVRTIEDISQYIKNSSQITLKVHEVDGISENRVYNK